MLCFYCVYLVFLLFIVSGWLWSFFPLIVGDPLWWLVLSIFGYLVLLCFCCDRYELR